MTLICYKLVSMEPEYTVTAKAWTLLGLLHRILC